MSTFLEYCSTYALAWLQLWKLGPITWSRYLPTDEFYSNYFLIDLDWLEHAKNLVWFQKTGSFKNENNQKVSQIKVLLLILYSSMKKTKSTDFWHRKMRLKTKNSPPFLCSNQSNEKIIFVSEHYIFTPHSLFGSITVIMLLCTRPNAPWWSRTERWSFCLHIV